MATRATLRDNARMRADQDSSDFPTDDQYNVYLDKAAARVWRQLVRLGWKPDRGLKAITANSAVAYEIGEDVSTILYVHRVDGTIHYQIQRLKDEERTGLMGRTGEATRYEIVGGATGPLEIELWPTPTSGSYQVRYVKKWVGFDDDQMEWLGPDGSDELIELDAAIQGTMKENGDPSDLKQQLNAAWDDVIAGAGWLDGLNPGTVRDANGLSLKNDPYSWTVDPEW